MHQEYKSRETANKEDQNLYNMSECVCLWVRVCSREGGSSERETDEIIWEIVRERSAIELFEEVNKWVPPQGFRHLRHGSGVEATDQTLGNERGNLE